MPNVVVSVRTAEGEQADATATFVVTQPQGQGLHVTLKFADGKTAEFDQSKAVDLGDYHNIVHQRCLRQIASGYGDYRDAFSVDFRPDVNSSRVEVVVEYGTNFIFSTTGLPKTNNGTTALHIIEPYTATISGGSLAAPVNVNVPYHVWSTRWRYQSAQRPLIRTYQDLVDMRLILPLTRKYAYDVGIDKARPWQGPMGVGPMSSYMPGAGGRSDIGFISEWMGAWLVTGSADAEINWRGAAEATGSMPFWCRDIGTGALLDISTYPYISYNDAHYTRYQMPRPINKLPDTFNTFVIDTAHMPPVSLVPFALTDDPYFLEAAQATGNFHTLESNYAAWHSKLPLKVSSAQTRSFAWGLRDVFQLAVAMPDTVPSWFLPRSHWRDKVCPEQRRYGELFLNNKVSPCTTVFKGIPSTCYTSAFMGTYLDVVIGWIKWNGSFSFMDPIIEYAAHPRLAMSDPDDRYGWDHRFPLAYYWPIFDARLGAGAGQAYEYGSTVPASSNTPESWAELWQLLSTEYAPARASGWTDPSTWPPDAVAPDKRSAYFPWIRAGLASLALAGLPRAAECHQWMDDELTRYNRYDGANGYSWAIPPTYSE